MVPNERLDSAAGTRRTEPATGQAAHAEWARHVNRYLMPCLPGMARAHAVATIVKIARWPLLGAHAAGASPRGVGRKIQLCYSWVIEEIEDGGRVGG